MTLVKCESLQSSLEFAVSPMAVLEDEMRKSLEAGDAMMQS